MSDPNDSTIKAGDMVRLHGGRNAHLCTQGAEWTDRRFYGTYGWVGGWTDAVMACGASCRGGLSDRGRTEVITDPDHKACRKCVDAAARGVRQ